MIHKSSGVYENKIYVITSAQSCAAPHGNFLKGLEKYTSLSLNDEDRKIEENGDVE